MYSDWGCNIYFIEKPLIWSDLRDHSESPSAPPLVDAKMSEQTLCITPKHYNFKIESKRKFQVATKLP